jgi:MFS family permease
MKKKLTLYYLHDFFGNLDFTRGIFVLFLLDRGLSLGMVGVLQTLLFWSNMVFEVPSGFFADHLKRKYSIVVGLLLNAIAAFMMPFVHSTLLYAVGFALTGAGFAFRSGADKALLYDELQADGWSPKFLKLSAWSRNIGNISLLVAMATGGFVQTRYGWHFVYFIYGFSKVIAAVLALSIDERKVVAKASVEKQELGLMESLKIFITSREGRALGLFIFGMGFIEAMHAPFFIYIQHYFKGEGMSTSAVSLTIGVSLGLTSIGYLFVERLDKLPIAQLIQRASLLLIALTAVFLFHPPLAFAVVLFPVIEMVPSLVFVHSDTHITDQLPARIRASLLSVHSFINSIFVSMAFLIAGQMMDFFSAGKVLGCLTILPATAFLFFSLYFARGAEKVVEVPTT